MILYPHKSRCAKFQTDENQREKKPGMENWKEVIAHRPDVLLEDFEIFSDYLAVSERQKGLVNIRVMSWDKKERLLP